MVQKSKAKPARKTVAKKAATRRAAPAKPKAKAAKPKSAAAKAGPSAKRAAPRKAAPKKAAAKKPARRSRGASTPRPAKSKNIFRRKSKAAKPEAREQAVADQMPVAVNAALIAALDEALAPAPTAPFETPQDAEQRTGTSDFLAPGQGRPPKRRPAAEEAGAESAESPARVNKLVPTNAVHTTKRRMKRNTWQSPALGLAAIAAVMAILVLGRESEPPDVSPLERRAETPAGPRAPGLALAPRVQNPQQAAPDRGRRTPLEVATPAIPTWGGETARPGEDRASDPRHGLKVLELVEMERMLKRLDMGPSQPDGVVDPETESAIRMYQQIAGLPVDGEPSPELLDDMREVVKLLDGEN